MTATPEYRQNLARLLNQLADIHLKLLEEANANLRKSDEPDASVTIRSDIVGHTPIVDARIDTIRRMVVVYDLMAAVGDMLLTQNRIGYGVAPLVRATWETLSHVWFLIEPDNDLGRLTRYLAQRLHQLETVSNKTKSAPPSPEYLEFAKRHDELKNEIAKTPIKLVTVPGYAALAVALYNETYKDASSTEARLFYSKLSSIAHGESGQHLDFVINRHSIASSDLSSEDHFPQVTLMARDTYLEEVIGTLVTIHGTVFLRLHEIHNFDMELAQAGLMVVFELLELSPPTTSQGTNKT